MGARLATSVLVGGLMRMAEVEGGFAAVLAKGDETAGAVIVILTERGMNPRYFERILQTDGHYSWQSGGDQRLVEPAEVPGFIARRRRSDPDLWIVELDVPSAERFAAEMNLLD